MAIGPQDSGEYTDLGSAIFAALPLGTLNVWMVGDTYHAAVVDEQGRWITTGYGSTLTRALRWLTEKDANVKPAP